MATKEASRTRANLSPHSKILPQVCPCQSAQPRQTNSYAESSVDADGLNSVASNEFSVMGPSS